MLHKITRLAVAAAIIYVIAGCGTVDQAATEAENAFQNGMRSADTARDLGVKKEAAQDEF
ncbi:MAG: hypothetical protein IIC97_02040 [Chloroflexi bacterium]|nr:hypothetical protein [Chloroflexota bacterium]